MTRVYTLKNGETFTSPSLFVNPQVDLDARALLEASAHDLENIDGIVFDIYDHAKLSEALGFGTEQLAPSGNLDLRKKVRLIDPALHHLLGGSEEEKEQMFKTGLFDARVVNALRKLSLDDIPAKEKPKRIIDGVYPYLTVKPSIEYQIRHDASAIISPVVNLSSKLHLSAQIAKATSMLKDTRTLLETSFKSYIETRDLINVITLNYKLAEYHNYADLFRLALINRPDQVGWKFLGIRESDSDAVKKMFAFLRDFATYSMDVLDRKEPIPMHLFNVDELGYDGYCSAVCNIVCPIATTPYYAFPSKDAENREIDTSPTYYHPIDMNHPKLNSIDELPCSCFECRRFHDVSRVPKGYKPIFRRKHWLYVKDGEIRQLRTTPARLDIALRDKFANSMRPQLVAYIPQSPLFVTNTPVQS